MNICAMSLGPPLVLIVAILLAGILILTFLIMLIVKLFKKSLTWRFILFTTFLAPISVIIVGLLFNIVYDFMTSPMKVKESDLEGDYIINTDLFKGENTEWQYEHYWLRIEKDTLYLNIMNEGKLIHTYKKKINHSWKGGRHDFFEFYGEYKFRNDHIMYIRNEGLNELNAEIYKSLPNDTMYGSIRVKDSVLNARILEAYPNEHHMLKLNPLLHADPFMFNVVLRSTKYGNMFFRKGKWKRRRK